ncbi:MAG: hypothetical protein ACREC0_06965 [Methylocella sp.]
MIGHSFVAIAFFILPFMAIFPSLSNEPQSHAVEPAWDAVAVNSTFFSPRLIAAIAPVSSRLHVAGAALIFAIVDLPPVHPISTSGGCSNSAMPHEVTSYAADNRTFNATGCLRISWENERKGRNTEETRNQKRFIHEFLLVQAL